jgi:hypothetical protein
MQQVFGDIESTLYGVCFLQRDDTWLWPQIDGTITELLRLQPDREILNFVEEDLIFETGESYRLATTLSLTRSCPRGMLAVGLTRGLTLRHVLSNIWAMLGEVLWRMGKDLPIVPLTPRTCTGSA